MTYPIQPIRKDILFTFEDGVTSDGIFKEDTGWDFELIPSAVLGSGHRVAKILAVGSDCTSVQAGMRVVVEALMWTKQLDVFGQACWKTDESKIIAFATED